MAQQPTLFKDDAPQPRTTKASPKTAAKHRKPGNNVSAKDVKKFAAADPAKHPGTAVAIHQPRRAVAQPAKITNAMQMLSFIGQASMDPDVKPEKMQALLDIRKQLKAEESADAYNAAILKLMREIATIRITKKGLIQIFAKTDPDHQRPPIQSTKYSKYDDLNRIIRPILHRHGFVLQHRNASAPDGKPITITTLRHAGGHSVESEFMGEIDASGSKNNVQGRGSTLSYGKRYNAVSLLDIITEEDDDGTMGAQAVVTLAQVDQITKACEVVGLDVERLRKHLAVAKLAELPASRFEPTMEFIRRQAGKA